MNNGMVVFAVIAIFLFVVGIDMLGTTASASYQGYKTVTKDEIRQYKELYKKDNRGYYIPIDDAFRLAQFNGICRETYLSLLLDRVVDDKREQKRKRAFLRECKRAGWMETTIQ